MAAGRRYATASYDKTRIARCTLNDSLGGDHVVRAGITGEVTIGDHSEVRADA